MIKRILIVAGVIVVILVLIEVISLVKLQANINNYAAYWRANNKNTKGDFTYLVLGDSGAQGIGASKATNGYVSLLAQEIQAKTGKSVRIVNLSASGAKISDVISKQLPELKKYSADLITVEVGSNNVVSYDSQQFAEQYNQLAGQLPKGSLVANIPYFGGRIRKNTQALAANQIISAAAQRNGLILVDLQTPTRQQHSLLNYAPDLFHPNNRSYKIWTAAFWQVVEPTLKT